LHRIMSASDPKQTLAGSDVHPLSYAKQTLITLVEQMAKWQSQLQMKWTFPRDFLPFDCELWFSVTTSEHYLGFLRSKRDFTYTPSI
jgi:hypothetical protein